MVQNLIHRWVGAGPGGPSIVQIGGVAEALYEGMALGAPNADGLILLPAAATEVFATDMSGSISEWDYVNPNLTLPSPKEAEYIGGELVFPFPNGHPGGTLNGRVGLETSQWDTGPVTHLSFKMRYSANWQGHDSNINKVVFFGFLQESGTSLYFEANGSDQNPMYATIVCRGTNANTLYGGDTKLTKDGCVGGSAANWISNGIVNSANPSDADAEIVRGEEHLIEVLFEHGTPGNSDGRIAVANNGVVVLDYRDFPVTRPGETPGMRRLNFDPVWGGTGDTLTQDQTLYIDDVVWSSAAGTWPNAPEGWVDVTPGNGWEDIAPQALTTLFATTDGWTQKSGSGTSANGRAASIVDLAGDSVLNEARALQYLTRVAHDSGGGPEFYFDVPSGYRKMYFGGYSKLSDNYWGDQSTILKLAYFRTVGDAWWVEVLVSQSTTPGRYIRPYIVNQMTNDSLGPYQATSAQATWPVTGAWFRWEAILDLDAGTFKYWTQRMEDHPTNGVLAQSAPVQHYDMTPVDWPEYTDMAGTDYGEAVLSGINGGNNANIFNPEEQTLQYDRTLVLCAP